MSIIMANEPGFGAVRNTDPQTSRVAARRNSFGRESKYVEILAFIRGVGHPVTNEEIAAGLGCEQIGDISPRVSEMLNSKPPMLVKAGIGRSSRGSAMRLVTLA